MAENQILPFAYADGANVLSQGDYQADNQRLIGHQPGIARSALENKALRQATTMAAGLAQFIADGQAADVTDAKTPAEIAAMLLAANAAQMPDATQSDAGKVRIATDAEAKAWSATDATLSPRGLERAFYLNSGRGPDTGYTILPSGFILQCGRSLTTTGFATTVFPIAFPDVCYAIIATPLEGNPLGEKQYTINIPAISTTNFNSTVLYADGSAPTSFRFTWFAIGV